MVFLHTQGLSLGRWSTDTRRTEGESLKEIPGASTTWEPQWPRHFPQAENGELGGLSLDEIESSLIAVQPLVAYSPVLSFALDQNSVAVWPPREALTSAV